MSMWGIGTGLWWGFRLSSEEECSKMGLLGSVGFARRYATALGVALA